MQAEAARLRETKRKQDDMIARIKAVFAESEEEREGEVEYCGRREGVGVHIVNRLTGEGVAVQGRPSAPQPFRLYTRPATAVGLPRRMGAEEVEVEGEEGGKRRKSLEEAEVEESSEEDEELRRVLRISAIFGGEDVGRLGAFLPADCLASPPPGPLAGSEAREEVKTKAKAPLATQARGVEAEEIPTKPESTLIKTQKGSGTKETKDKHMSDERGDPAVMKERRLDEGKENTPDKPVHDEPAKPPVAAALAAKEEEVTNSDIDLDIDELLADEFT